MKHYIAAILTCLLGFTSTLPLRAQERRLPEPTPLEQEETSKLIKKLYKSEYSKRTTTARRDLGKVLLAQAKKETTDEVAKFVLLRETIGLSSRGADLDTALNAFRMMEDAYLIDSLKVKEDLLSVFPRTKSLILEETVFDEWMSLVDNAIEADDYSAADRLAGRARKRASRDKLLLGIAKKKEKYVDALEKRFKKVTSSFESLADDPGNVEANGIVGEFLSLYKREWKTGLALAAKGPPGGLKKLADEESDAPSVPLELESVADGWWKMAQDTKDVVQISCLMRAAYWSRKVLAGLDGLGRIAVEKRLAEIEKTIGVSRGIKLSELQVLCYQDRRWRRHPLEKMTLSRRGKALSAKNTSGISSYALLSSKRLLRGDFSATVHVFGGRMMGITSDDLRSKRLEIDLKKGWQLIRVERVGDQVTFTVNGRPLQWKPSEYYSYYGEVKPEQTSFLFISLSSGQQCSIQTLEIETETEEYRDGSGDGDDGDRDRDRDGRRGRSGGRGRGRSGN